VFKGRNQGLVVAEIELATEMAQFSLLLWVGDEVSDEMRYVNSNLISSPFYTWRD
jgi:adenylate cyclase